MKDLLFLGDSITDCNHYFDPENLGQGYVRMIYGKINTPDKIYQVLNKGNDGFTVPAVRRLWKRSCLNLQPDFITILIGINDLAVMRNTGITASVGLADFREQYQTLIDDIRMMTDCPILLMEPFIFPYPAEYSTWEPELHAMSEIIQDIASKNQVTFLPLWENLLLEAKKYGYSEITIDGIHLTKYGHQLIAEKWIEKVNLL
ncbi:MAG: GDSL-type esterase/lipase family protein [Lachnospiraceae bacterium]|nr:GDSL-type esterase/lipase family protein [Lachnospiraceae bacterium]